MKLSVSEKRLIFLAFVGLLIILGFALEKNYGKTEESQHVVARKTVEFPIDVNSASYEDLLEIPGIGPAKAKAVIQFREQNGPFATVDDLTKVSGIGRVTVQRIAPYVKVEGAVITERTKKINVNKATVEELMQLPGIGEVKASEIIKFRQQRGIFSKPDDLLQVPGIGPKTLEKIKDMITF
ncbi:ComEA family DNA-binding protein [Pseudothermotoga sp. U03pept]|uniref:ComEA family DNA-binding protein n=1 Tax=Pseudothermotoga sp. U03pept TaxID=3447012 RepID=UPI003F0073D2